MWEKYRLVSPLESFLAFHYCTMIAENETQGIIKYSYGIGKQLIDSVTIKLIYTFVWRMSFQLNLSLKTLTNRGLPVLPPRSPQPPFQFLHRLSGAARSWSPPDAHFFSWCRNRDQGFGIKIALNYLSIVLFSEERHADHLHWLWVYHNGWKPGTVCIVRCLQKLPTKADKRDTTKTRLLRLLWQRNWLLRPASLQIQVALFWKRKGSLPGSLMRQG